VSAASRGEVYKVADQTFSIPNASLFTANCRDSRMDRILKVSRHLNRFQTHDGPVNHVIYRPDEGLLALHMDVPEEAWPVQGKAGIFLFYDVEIKVANPPLENRFWSDIDADVLNMNYLPELDTQDKEGVFIWINVGYESHEKTLSYQEMKFITSRFEWFAKLESLPPQPKRIRPLLDEERFLEALLEAAPSFATDYQDMLLHHRQYYSDDDLSIWKITSAPLVKFALNLFHAATHGNKGAEAELNSLFKFIDETLQSDNEGTRNVLTTGYLEHMEISGSNYRNFVSRMPLHTRKTLYDIERWWESPRQNEIPLD
jgi:hypothetical protein